MLVFTWGSFFTLHFSKLLFKTPSEFAVSLYDGNHPENATKCVYRFFCVLFFANWIFKSSCFRLYFSISGDSCLHNWSHARISMCEVAFVVSSFWSIYELPHIGPSALLTFISHCLFDMSCFRKCCTNMWSWYELSTDNFVRTKTTCVIYPTCLPNVGARKGYTSLHVASAAGQHNGLEHLFDQYLGDGIHYRPTQVITSPMVCFFGFIHFILLFALNGRSKTLALMVGSMKGSSVSKDWGRQSARIEVVSSARWR